MADLNYTAARHKMLTEVAEGKRRVMFGMHRNLITADGIFPKGAQKRTALDVDPFVGPRGGYWGTTATALLTDEGRSLLAGWDARYGKVEN